MSQIQNAWRAQEVQLKVGSTLSANELIFAKHGMVKYFGSSTIVSHACHHNSSQVQRLILQAGVCRSPRLSLHVAMVLHSLVHIACNLTH